MRWPCLAVALVLLGSTTAALAEPVELSVWTRIPRENSAIFFEEFQKQNPDIVLHVEHIPGGKNHINKLMAAYTAGTVPDVTELDTIGTEQFARLGALMPLDDLVAEDEALSLDRFVDAHLETARYDGKLYGLPFSAGTSAVLFNRDMFEARGLDPDKPPRTWDEFTEAAKKLTFERDDGERVYGFAFVPAIPNTTTYFWLSYLLAAGGVAEDPEAGVFRFNEEPAVRALTFLMDLHHEHDAVLPSAIGASAEHDLYIDLAQQRVAMVFGNSSWIGRLEDAPLEFDVGAFGHTTPSAEVPSTGILGNANITILEAIPEEKLPAAIKLVEFLTSAAGQKLWWTAKWGMPVLPELIDDPHYDDFPIEKAFFGAYARAQAPMRTSHFVEVQQYLRDAFQEVAFGMATPQEALDRAAEKANALVQRTGTF